jgi:inhibitor of cysteine peptidase
VSEVHLTKDDTGSMVEVSPGDMVTVTLDQTASTGYRWTVDNGTEPVLAFSGDETRSSPAVGSKGSVEWSFRAAQPGTTKLRLKLWRDWEGDKSVIERFETTVQVQ